MQAGRQAGDALDDILRRCWTVVLGHAPAVNQAFRISMAEGLACSAAALSEQACSWCSCSIVILTHAAVSVVVRFSTRHCINGCAP